MFHIFNKKRFLVDALKGFVDIHNHLLPGIDDGAKTVEDSIAMIREFESFGVTKFIATPHIMADYYPNTPITIANALGKLKSELLMQGKENITIEAAAEHMIDQSFENLFENKEIMPLKFNYLLIEMSYLQASLNFESAIERITSAGFFPILAHPERYRYLHSKRKVLKEYKKKNVLFQLNLLSLSDYYGSDIQKFAFQLLEKNKIDFVGSDVHTINQLKSLKEITVSEKVYDKIVPIVQNTIREFY
ncbi:tyrosine-protein phosphatase [Muriicola sp. E247]|uniref:tyrosine-protein phosphatase n=1 Tax=Muriicola sp. E247 TaxID=3242730 RepID=UPI00352496AC